MEDILRHNQTVLYWWFALIVLTFVVSRWVAKTSYKWYDEPESDAEVRKQAVKTGNVVALCVTALSVVIFATNVLSNNVPRGTIDNEAVNERAAAASNRK